MERIGKFIDSLRGKEAIACKEDDKKAQLLVNSGLDLLQEPEETTLTSSLPILELGTPQEVHQALKNLQSVYLPNFSLSEDILANITIGELITHLEAKKVEAALNILIKKEREGVIQTTQAALSDLKKQFSRTV